MSEKLKSLLYRSLLYRIHIITLQSIFFYVLTGKCGWSVGVSVVWNTLSTALYFNFHFWYSKFFGEKK